MAPPKRIYGLIGYPVKHSLSPAMQRAAFRASGIDAEYRLFEVKPQGLHGFLGTSVKEMAGFNVTIPHKVRVKEILAPGSEPRPGIDIDIKEYAVYFTGAVNTVKIEGRQPSLHNTDVLGFVRSLKLDLGFGPKDKRVLLIGCGGAGRAVAAGLTVKDGCAEKIYIYELNAETRNSAAEHFSRVSSELPRLKGKFEFIAKDKISETIKKCHLLVNASPVGMKDGDHPPIDKGLLRKGLFVYDLVYNKDTRLVREAKSLGLAARGGLGMLLYQGAASFTLWTGKKAPIEIMRQALVAAKK